MEPDFSVYEPVTPIISLFEDAESRWQAIVSRNPNADGFFVYAVKTTKIFCRPICKARLARRPNVAFFANSRQALRAGYRPCKRCKPDLEGFMPEEAAVQKIRSFVRDREAISVGGGGGNDNARMSLSQMAMQTGLSKWHFHRVFKKCVGLTPGEYLQQQRSQQRHQQNRIGDDQGVFNLVNFDFDLGGLGDDVGDSGAGTSSGNTSEGIPWSIDDLLIWPEETWQTMNQDMVSRSNEAT